MRTCRQHAGGVYCLAKDTAAGSAGRAVWSGSNDFTCNMWQADGTFRKLYSGHSGGVRSILGEEKRVCACVVALALRN